MQEVKSKNKDGSPPLFFPQTEDMHHFRKPANDITSQLEINFGDLCRPSRGRGGPRGGRGGRGRGAASGPGFSGESTRPARPRTDKVEVLLKVIRASVRRTVPFCFSFFL